MILHRRIPSPIGPLLLAADDRHLRGIGFSAPRHPPPDEATLAFGDNALLRETAAQLAAYFAQRLQRFDLPLRPIGTAFQQRVWETLAMIPFGATWSYRDVAERIDRPTATRAVGAANGRNPIPIVLPCHRVVGADGSLTGFGGGLPAKGFLLALEGASPRGDLFDAAAEPSKR